MKLSAASARAWIFSWSGVFSWKAKFTSISLRSMKVTSVPSFAASCSLTARQTWWERDSGLRDDEMMRVCI